MRLPILFGLLVSLLTSSLCAQQGRRHDPRPDATPRRIERTAPEPRGLPHHRPLRGFQQRAPLAHRRQMMIERMRMQMRQRFQAQRFQAQGFQAQGFSRPELRQRIVERLRSRQEAVRGGEAPRRAEAMRRPGSEKPAPQQAAPKAPKKRRIV